MREIGAEAGVDPALVSRYFGCKEELFRAVLDTLAVARELIEGDRATFGQRTARRLLYPDAAGARDFQGLLLLLRSIGSSKALQVISESAEARFFAPFTAWVGGEDARIRARMATTLILGAAVNEVFERDTPTNAQEQDAFCESLASLLQSLIDG